MENEWLRERKPSNKKLLSGLLAVFCVMAVVSACGRKPSQPSSSPAPETVQSEVVQSETAQTTQPPAAETSGAAQTEAVQAAPETVAETAGASSAAESDVSSVIPHYDMRFYLKNLDPSLQEDVIALYSGIKEFSPKIELPEWTTAENADLLVFVIKLDCPELFQVSDSGNYTITTTNGMASSVSLPYSMTKEQYDERLEECNELIRGLVMDVSDRDEESKERYVYEYLTDRVNYSVKQDQCGNAYGALVNCAAKCDGISLAAKWIFEEMGMPALVITGQEQGDPYGHAWNCVSVNGAYYDLDLTNDSRTFDKVMKLYGAYNVKRSWLSDIYPVSPEIRSNYQLPDPASMSDSFHVRNGSYIYGGDDIRSRFYELLDEAAEQEDPCLIQFEEDSDYQTFMNEYESYAESWFNARGCGGGFRINALNEFRTAGLKVTIDN